MPQLQPDRTGKRNNRTKKTYLTAVTQVLSFHVLTAGNTFSIGQERVALVTRCTPEHKGRPVSKVMVRPSWRPSPPSPLAASARVARPAGVARRLVVEIQETRVRKPERGRRVNPCWSTRTRTARAAHRRKVSEYGHGHGLQSSGRPRLGSPKYPERHLSQRAPSVLCWQLCGRKKRVDPRDQPPTGETEAPLRANGVRPAAETDSGSYQTVSADGVAGAGVSVTAATGTGAQVGAAGEPLEAGRAALTGQARVASGTPEKGGHCSGD